MAAYPSLPVCDGSKIERKSGVEIDRATNGAARGRNLYSADKSEFKLKHNLITAAQRTTLDAFYAANKNITFTFTFDGTTYTCLFSSAPQYEPLPGAYYDALVEMVEV